MRRLALLLLLPVLVPAAPADAVLCQYVEVDGREVAHPCVSYAGHVTCIVRQVGPVFAVVCTPDPV